MNISKNKGYVAR